MQRRQFLQSAAAAGAGLMLSTPPRGDAADAPADHKLIGMYVHQHWPYNHPYAGAPGPTTTGTAIWTGSTGWGSISC